MDYFIYALNLCAVALVLGGIMLFIHDQFHIEPAFLPILTVSLITLITYAGGLLGLLAPVTVAIYALGAVALIYETIRMLRRKYSPKEFLISPGIWFFALLCIYFVFRMKGMLVQHVDNFSHWATIIKEMCLTDGFPVENTVITFRNYTPGSAVFVYFVCKAVTFTEGHALMAQGIMIASALAAIFCKVKLRNVVSVLSLAAVSVLALSIPELLSASLSIYNFLVDGIMAYIIAAGGIIVFAYRRDIKRCMLTLIPVMGMLVIIKSSARIFAALITVFAVAVFAKELFRKKNYWVLLGWGLLLAGQLVFPALYNGYVAHTFPAHTDKFSSDLGGLLSYFTEKEPAYLREIASKMIAELTDLSSVSVRAIIAAELVALAVLALMLILRKKPRIILPALICANLTGIFYIGELYILYGFIFDEYEAGILASFYRYFATGATLMVLVLLTAGVYQLKAAAAGYDGKRAVPAVLSVVMLVSSVAPLCTAATNVIQLIDPYYQEETAARLAERKHFSQFFSAVAEQIPANSNVLVYTENTSFFASSVPMYELMTNRYGMLYPSTFSDAETAQEKLRNRDYVTVDGDAATFREYMGSLGYSVIGEDAVVYRIAADAKTLTAIQ